MPYGIFNSHNLKIKVVPPYIFNLPVLHTPENSFRVNCNPETVYKHQSIKRRRIVLKTQHTDR